MAADANQSGVSSNTNVSFCKIPWLCKSCHSQYFGIWLLLHTLSHVTNSLLSVVHEYFRAISESILHRKHFVLSIPL